MRIFRILFLLASLLTPALTTWGTLYLTHDALTTLIMLSVFCYISSIYIYSEKIDSFLWQWELEKEKRRSKGTLVASTIIFLISAFCTFYGLFTFSLHYKTPLLHKLKLPFPYMDSSTDQVYQTIFFIFFCFILPISEDLFYRVFQVANWEGFLAEVMLSISYAGMNYAWVNWVIVGEEVLWIMTIASFLYSFLAYQVQKGVGVYVGLMFRIGFSVGLCAWILFLGIRFYGGKKFYQPGEFVVGDKKNIYF